MSKLTRKQRTERATNAILSVVSPAIAKLRDAGNVATPSVDVATRAIRGCINSNNGRWRKSKPSDDVAGLLWDLLRFHNGNGSLWGYPWFADPKQRDELDTLAIVLLDCKSNASDAWAKAIHGK